jgi:tetratricopeptide (TPR) repeat protein
MNRLYLILFLGLFLRCPLEAQVNPDTAFDAVAKRGIDEVYNLEFERADSDFTQLVRLNPNRPVGHFFSAMVLWWRIMIDLDNEQYDNEFFTALDNVIEMCDSILDKNENDVDAIFFKGGAIGFKGRLKFHRDDYLAAANAGRKALPLVQEAIDLAPRNYDILLGAGMYNYYADVIPQEYPFLKPVLLFIPPGDKKKGIEQLKLASQKGRYASVEAAYFLMQLYFYYEKDYTQALEIARRLHDRYPNNMLFHKFLGRCYVLTNNWQMVHQAFGDVVARVQMGQRGYNAVAEREAEYYLGQYDMNVRQFDNALNHFFRCDELSRTLDRSGPSGFMVMSNVRIGNVFDMQGKRAFAIKQYQKVSAWKDYKGSVSMAEQFIKTPYAQ